MITRVDTVLIGKTCPASYSTVDALSAGDIALFDESRKLITTEAAAADAVAVYAGVCTGKVTITLPNGDTASKSIIDYSNKITNDNLSYVVGAYTAPVQDVIAISLASATITKGHRYVLRIVYKDLYEAPGQFTHTYEVIATDTTAATLGAAFVSAINKHKGRRVSVAYASNTLTLTALSKDDNETIDSINEYSVVSMDATLYYTIPGALLSNQPEKVAGVTITKTQGQKGKGYWKEVRDSEVRAMGYKGHVFTGSYPTVEQDRMVEKDATYDYVTIENDIKYLSPDNQYSKATPVISEIYVKSAASLSTSLFAKQIKSFASGFDTNQVTEINALIDANG